jgi:hypothetical protein
MVNFTASKFELELISQIAKRAVSMAKEAGINYAQMDALMDIEACHSNGNPLDLNALLSANPFDFAHDVFGIRRHIDRSTGKLTDCFSPRFTFRHKGGA